MAAMEKCGTTKLRLKKGSFEIELERLGAIEPLESPEDIYAPEEEKFVFRRSAKKGNTPLPKAADMSAALHPAEDETKKENQGTYITSPMVGTFYASPSPDDPPFVKLGDEIEKGTLVCIIEAMKVMNEIKAQTSGRVVEICVDNGHPVEFGTKLFRIQ